VQNDPVVLLTQEQKNTFVTVVEGNAYESQGPRSVDKLRISLPGEDLIQPRFLENLQASILRHLGAL